MVSDVLDALVIGAGAVGLAIAKNLAETYGTVCVVDQHRYVGAETSSRNSGVIHAGIYYPPGSLKASLCREGSQMLYAYCASRQVPHRKTGKIIVASGNVGLSDLNAIAQNASANGVELEELNVTQVKLLEPLVKCDYAMMSSETGIVDAQALMGAYVADLESSGGFVAFEHRVKKIELGADFHLVWFHDIPEPVRSKRIINAAGLHAAGVAQMMTAFPSKHIPKYYYAKGHYFKLAGKEQPFRRLVYPLPDRASLGIHATLDLAGVVRFGPDVEWVTDIGNYTVDPAREQLFRSSIAKYFPSVKDYKLEPDYAGIRPKIVNKGSPAADFRIDGPTTHGIGGLVNLFGIESPGLTSSLALAKYAIKLL